MAGLMPTLHPLVPIESSLALKKYRINPTSPSSARQSGEGNKGITRSRSRAASMTHLQESLWSPTRVGPLIATSINSKTYQTPARNQSIVSRAKTTASTNTTKEVGTVHQTYLVNRNHALRADREIVHQTEEARSCKRSIFRDWSSKND